MPRMSSPCRRCSGFNLALVVAAAALALALAAEAAQAQGVQSPQLVVNWTYVEWDFATQAEQEHYMSSGHYLNNVVAGGLQFSASTDDIFFASPRIKGNGTVPATVGRVTPGGARGPGGQPLARPFPSFEAHDPTSPDGIRSVFRLLLDARDRRWMLDTGRTGPGTGQPQLLVYADASTDAPRLLRRHRFPASVADPATSFLNDLTLDETRGIAFIANSANPSHGKNASVIVYDYLADESWVALSGIAAVEADEGLQMQVNGRDLVPNPVAGADGITLCGETVFFTPFTSTVMYSAPASTLANRRATVAERSEDVRVSRLDRGFASDGIVCDRRGRLWMGSMNDSALLVWDQAGTAPTSVARDAAHFQWPAVIGFDQRGGVFVFAIPFLAHLPLKTDQVNFEVWTVAGADAHSAMTGEHDFLAGGGGGGGGLGTTAIALLAVACAIVAGGVLSVVAARRSANKRASGGLSDDLLGASDTGGGGGAEYAPLAA